MSISLLTNPIAGFWESLAPGSYDLHIRADGYSSLEIGNIHVDSLDLVDLGIVSLKSDSQSLIVRSSPIDNVAISVPGTYNGISDEQSSATPFDTDAGWESTITLAAPTTFSDGVNHYKFVKWKFDQIIQSDGEFQISLDSNAFSAAEAIYIRAPENTSASLDWSFTIDATPIDQRQLVVGMLSSTDKSAHSGIQIPTSIGLSGGDVYLMSDANAVLTDLRTPANSAEWLLVVSPDNNTMELSWNDAELPPEKALSFFEVDQEGFPIKGLSSPLLSSDKMTISGSKTRQFK